MKSFKKSLSRLNEVLSVLLGDDFKSPLSQMKDRYPDIRFHI
jgi:hypothetical protein